MLESAFSNDIREEAKENKYQFDKEKFLNSNKNQIVDRNSSFNVDIMKYKVLDDYMYGADGSQSSIIELDEGTNQNLNEGSKRGSRT